MWRDDAYLLDMLIHARKACSFCATASLERFLADDLLQAAVLRVLQIVGEAASKVSPTFRESHPEISWQQIIGLRHRLVHDYPGLDLSKIWHIVREHVPALVASLEPLVPPPPSP